MKKKIAFILFASFLFSLNLVSAAHYIVGYVENASDGTPANNQSVVLWNPLNGESDNLTDIIGPEGNSGTDNEYSIDCELLDTPCQTGDEIFVRVYDTGEGYVSENNSVTISEQTSDTANLSLNSPPSVSSEFPGDNQNFSEKEIEFNCSASDLDGNLESITLYGNWSSGWHANETKEITGDSDYAIFTKNISEGRYKYNCLATDNLSISSFSSENKTFTIDTTSPIISSVQTNISYSCGTENYVRVNCTTSDSLTGVKKVWIEAIAENYSENYSSSLISGDTYYSDVLLNKTGEWDFRCYSKDYSNNSENYLLESALEVYSDSADLVVLSKNIIFSDNYPKEGQIIKINATILNKGCSDANSFTTGFYEGPPETGELIEEKTETITGRTNKTINISWNAKIGPTDIYVFADSGNIISEENENNNQNSSRINVYSWQTFFGNISIKKILGVQTYNLSAWDNEPSIQGNVFIANKEARINWKSLQAFGKTKEGSDSNNDFSELDELLGMSDYGDSVSDTFLDNGEPKNIKNFTIHQKIIEDVPITNSTNSSTSNFTTGILWDTSDSTDSEFDSTEKEDVVFVSEVQRETEGKYGVYDYELKAPAKLREYNTTNTEEFYFYYDLN